MAVFGTSIVASLHSPRPCPPATIRAFKVVSAHAPHRFVGMDGNFFGPLKSPISMKAEELVSDTNTLSTNKGKKTINNGQSASFKAAI